MTILRYYLSIVALIVGVGSLMIAAGALILVPFVMAIDGHVNFYAGLAVMILDMILLAALVPTCFEYGPPWKWIGRRK